MQLNPQDLQRLGLQDGDLAQVRSKRGSLVLPVQASEQLAPLQAFIAMRWGPEVLSGRDAQGQAVPGCERADHIELLSQFQAARAQARRRVDHSRGNSRHLPSIRLHVHDAQAHTARLGL